MQLPVPATLLRRFPESLFQRSISRALDRALWRSTFRCTAELNDLRVVIFSDHHRGRGDGADDFRLCEPAYAAALGFYLENGFHVWLLGDVEELWENTPEKVVRRYEDILDLERQFGPRLVRFFGNHDMAWRNRDACEKFLGRWLHTPSALESMTLLVTHEGQPLGRLFVLHGHQGTFDSGNFLITPLSRIVVQVFWATLQRRLGIPSTAPSSDPVLRGKHARAMHRWADEHAERIVLVAGHTHRPVFPGTRAPDPTGELRDADAAYEMAAADRRARARGARELAFVRALRAEPRPPDRQQPCYYNTGCCSFGDGDVTGLELVDGRIRLVRWLDDAGEAAAKCLAEDDLTTVFRSLRGVVPRAP